MTMRSEQEGVISDAEYLVGLTLYSPDAQIIPAAMSHVMVTLPLALTMQECIATLRTQLAAANIERAEWENAAGVYEAGMVRAERERDEARREREEWETNSATIINGMAAEADGLRHRAERMERVVLAARDVLTSMASEEVRPGPAVLLCVLQAQVKALDATRRGEAQ